jgi:hypothetical protein
MMPSRLVFAARLAPTRPHALAGRRARASLFSTSCSHNPQQAPAASPPPSATSHRLNTSVSTGELTLLPGETVNGYLAD